MDRVTKFIITFAIAFLAVVIGVGIGKKVAQKRIESTSLGTASVVPAQAKEIEPQLKTAEEKLKETKEGLSGKVEGGQEIPPSPDEGSLPPEYLLPEDPYSKTNPPLIRGFEDKYLSLEKTEEGELTSVLKDPFELTPSQSHQEILSPEQERYRPYPPAFSQEEFPPQEGFPEEKAPFSPPL